MVESAIANCVVIAGANVSSQNKEKWMKDNRAPFKG